MTELRVSRPAEGWVTLALVAGLAIIVAWAIDEPAWVFGRGAATDCLPTFALMGVAIGFAGPKLGWGRWTTHLMGAMFAALLIPVFVGWSEHPGIGLGESFGLVAAGTIDAYLDLAWRGMRLTDQDIHYTLLLGVLVWGTMQFASYAVFGHRRPLAAIIVMGLLLVGNMSVTLRNQLPYMIAFTAGSLFLLIQMHAFDERSTWIRRRIGDPSTISSLYLRGGTVFIVAAVVGSSLLTVRAASAPLAGAWSGISDRLVELSDDISRLLPVGGAVRPLGKLSFGSEARISPIWYSDDRIAFTATVPPEFQDQRWRAATYDTFAFNYWTQTESGITPTPVEAGAPILEGTPEQPADDLTTDVTVRVEPAEYRETLLLVPGAPRTVDRASSLLRFGEDGWFAGVALPGGVGGAYEATAAIPRIESTKGAEAQGITAGKLRAAGTAYPADIVANYTDVPEGSIGPAAAELLQAVIARSPGANPFDLANTMQSYLHSDRFRYVTNLTSSTCRESAVECFALERKGYCLHYASTMAVLLRDAIPGQPIPTRLVQGFLPGEASGNTTTVRIRDAHAWVEVYFPGYGWVPFDPTGDVGRPSRIPAGQPVAPASLLPLPSDEGRGRDPLPSRPALPSEAVPAPRDGGPDERMLLMVFALLLGGAVLALAVAAWLRGPRGELSPEAAWRSVARTASRLGVAPRPTQTVYEYASALGDLVPVAQRDIEVVATAKVESSYAGMKVVGARLDAVRDATRRLRISLLRLVFHRPRRRRR